MADTVIQRQQAFEAVLVDISSQFANVPSDQFESAIEFALRRLNSFLGFDRSFIAEFDAENLWLSVRCSVAVNGVEAWPRGPMSTFLNWYVSQTRRGKIITLRSHFPPEATAEIEYFFRSGMRSHLAIPLSVGGRIIATVGFDAFHHTQEWHFTPPITLLGKVFALALARKRAEDNLATALAEIERLSRERPSLPSDQTTCSRFGLTVAETYIALGIARGESLGQIATARGVAISTARRQLQSIFGKVGAHRQAELVVLLGRKPF